MDITKLRILYVEDDALIREATRIILERFATVFSAQDGEQALELYTEKQPNIVITDICMPVMDGLAMARKIREYDPYLPIIFVSANNDTEQLLEAIDLGADAFLVKPFSLQKLRDILKKFGRHIIEQEENKKTQRLLEEYKKAVDVSAILSVSDLDGNITFANDKLCEITGYTNKELLGKPHSILRHPETPSEVFADMWQTILAGKIWKGLIKNLKKNGETYYVDTTVVPILDEDNHIAHFLGIRHEITSIIQAQNSLKVALERAEEADRVKSVFLANMSHEMRTPLNGIIGFSKLLLEENLTPTQREYIEIIDKSGEHLLGIINDILDLSKIESGKFTIEKLPMYLESELKTVVDFCDVKAKEKGVSLNCKIESLRSLAVEGDAMRLKQVLANLLNNAIKFTPTGGCVTLCAEASSVGSNEIEVAFSVIDTGIGIAPHNLAKIFQPFEQAESSTARNYGGTGLGLSISLELVRIMGGEMSCKSVEGKGSEFSFTLRFPRSSFDEDSCYLLPSEPRFYGRVLVAEDNFTNQRLIKIMLEKMGLMVTIANNGAEALSVYQSGEFDIVLLDIQMPVMDGNTAQKRLREIQTESGRAIPIVVLSANAMANDRAKYLSDGFDACLAKPLIKTELIKVLSTYLELSIEESSNTPKSATAASSVPQSASARRARMSELLGLDEESFIELESDFLEYTGKDMESIIDSLKAGEHVSFERAHALKGASLNMGFDSLAGILCKIEQSARNNEPLEDNIGDTLAHAWEQAKMEVMQ
ncbi:MAG: response regulator [Wolinella sp.]